MKTAYEIDITGSLGSTLTYTSSSILTGSLLKTYVDNDGNTYIQPFRPVFNRIYDTMGTFDLRAPFAIPWSNDVDYIFLTNIAAAAATIRYSLVKFNRKTFTFNNVGHVLFTPSAPPAGATKAAVGCRGALYRYSSGSVEVNGSAVTGSSTNWITNRQYAGARIAFGTTTPESASTWYTIQSINSETSLTINGSTTAAAASPYVIEEIKLAAAFTNTSLSGSGVLLANGLCEDTYTIGGSSITEYTSGTTGSLTQGFYRMFQQETALGAPGIASSSMTLPTSIAFEPQISPTEHNLYVLNRYGTISYNIYKFNILANPGLIISGSSTGSFQYRTGVGVIVGTQLAGSNTMEIVTTGHGPGSGSLNAYIGTSNRIFRTPISSIVSGSTSFLVDSFTEVPPGSSTTLAATGITQIDYSGMLDKFYINASTTPFKFSMVEYNTTGQQSLRQMLPYYGMLNQLTSDADQPPLFTGNGTTPVFNSHRGIWYVIGGSTTTNTLSAFGTGADWSNAQNSKQWVTFPVIHTPGALEYYSVYPRMAHFSGPDNLGVSVERVKLYYRTTGIADDSGAWTEVPVSGKLSGVTVGSEIQFSLAWDTFGLTGITAPVYGITLVYEDGSQDSHYLPSVSLSSASAREFVWRQAQLWPSSIPNLRLKLYNSVTDFLVLDDTVNASVYGTWTYSSNSGSTWNAWDNTANTVGNYIKYTANSLPANTILRALLTTA